MFQQMSCKQICIWFPLAAADSGQQEYVALIPNGFTLDQLVELDPELAAYVLIHPRTYQQLVGDLYQQLEEGAVIYGIPQAKLSMFTNSVISKVEGAYDAP